ncbi:hypothetical protein A8990_13135 [Paenibacillus taihuensis]|uniref:Uncharacterized protein n=1 Tax=Paenibacillus taihuensis TaxID=1156355 RepID=A0A3D9R3S5_9BACL|nr:hypothetical protein [Paenibacillus taihuensis]REE69716.1 hypothetical protein A8990_13135 [Paenibacillus taihuensis]
MIVKIIAFVAVLVCWTFYIAKSLLHKKRPKTAAVYCCLMALCIVEGALYLADVYFPFSIAPVRFFFEPIGKKLLTP